MEPWVHESLAKPASFWLFKLLEVWDEVFLPYLLKGRASNTRSPRAKQEVWEDAEVWVHLCLHFRRSR